MGRRTSKKDKKIKVNIIFADTDTIGYYKQRNSWWGEHMRRKKKDKKVTIELKVSDNPTLDVSLQWDWVREFNNEAFPYPGRWDDSKVISTYGKCVICKFHLHNKFPEDFPEDWKFCCNCQNTALLIVRGTLTPLLIREKKIYNKITVYNGGNNRT